MYNNMRLYIVEIVMGVLICLLVIYLVYSMYILLSDVYSTDDCECVDDSSQQFENIDGYRMGMNFGDGIHACYGNAPCCDKSPYGSMRIEELNDMSKNPEVPSFSDNFVNDRYSGVVHKFTDGELMDALLNKSRIEDVGNWEEYLIADDMSAQTADNKLLAKNKHTHEMARANEAISASINTKMIASDLAHESEEAWWGEE